MAIIFWILAVITVGSALLMVTSKNLFHSALFMVVTFIGVAGVYLMLKAEFLAAVQILIYAGAITIFIVFGIMLTAKGSLKQTNLYSGSALPAAVVSFALIIINAVMVIKTKWPQNNVKPPEETVPQIADLMLSKYIIPFEVAALLLLVALLGAIIIAKEVKKTS